MRVDPELARDLEKYGVTYTGFIENNIIAKLLSRIVPIVVFFALWMYVFRRSWTIPPPTISSLTPLDVVGRTVAL